jgi:hypothetical protein
MMERSNISLSTKDNQFNGYLIGEKPGDSVYYLPLGPEFLLSYSELQPLIRPDYGAIVM